jgi:hypothetical protein
MAAADAPQRAYLRVGERKVPIPRSKAMRMLLGVLFVLGGVLPLVPPGAGGIPVGLTLLSIDNPRLRRPRRRVVVWGGRRIKSFLARQAAKSARETAAT